MTHTRRVDIDNSVVDVDSGNTYYRIITLGIGVVELYRYELRIAGSQRKVIIVIMHRQYPYIGIPCYNLETARNSTDRACIDDFKGNGIFRTGF